MLWLCQGIGAHWQPYFFNISSTQCGVSLQTPWSSYNECANFYEWLYPVLLDVIFPCFDSNQFSIFSFKVNFSLTSHIFFHNALLLVLPDFASLPKWTAFTLTIIDNPAYIFFRIAIELSNPYTGFITESSLFSVRMLSAVKISQSLATRIISNIDH